MEAVVFTGVQGVGKSTWYARTYLDTHVRLSLDMLRTRHRETVLLHACLAVGTPFVVDNTNPKASTRARYVRLASAAGFETTAVEFEVDVEIALERNARRTGPARVPDVAILGTAAKSEPVTQAEGFDRVVTVGLDHDGVLRVLAEVARG